MICAQCWGDIDENVEPHWSFHDEGCGFSKRGWCYCPLLSVHPECCDCTADYPCLPSVPVQIRRGGGRLPEPLASEEAAS